MIDMTTYCSSNFISSLFMGKSMINLNCISIAIFLVVHAVIYNRSSCVLYVYALRFFSAVNLQL